MSELAARYEAVFDSPEEGRPLSAPSPRARGGLGGTSPPRRPSSQTPRSVPSSPSRPKLQGVFGTPRSVPSSPSRGTEPLPPPEPTLARPQLVTAFSAAAGVAGSPVRSPSPLRTIFRLYAIEPASEAAAGPAARQPPAALPAAAAAPAQAVRQPAPAPPSAGSLQASADHADAAAVAAAARQRAAAATAAPAAAAAATTVRRSESQDLPHGRPKTSRRSAAAAAGTAAAEGAPRAATAALGQRGTGRSPLGARPTTPRETRRVQAAPSTAERTRARARASAPAGGVASEERLWR